MEFNKTKTEIKQWFQDLMGKEITHIEFKEEINFQNVQTLSIDFESKISLGIIIIYEDNHLFFDFMKKNDSEMKSSNWSEVFFDQEDLKERIEKSLSKYW
ncbi:hypothetical protein PY092_10045 [Muricauda sp. 334s03]|uniref:Uncharacterized protein n=1 Tax=Flagellimonas yonaguniensis TaxID=3031325 RepID=A0ABT5XZ82_9FLAO|nr:hypothetical protein [[Muricauda] yonaguniensis]MDF0716490.1 hypothetical protein [[Muricauda] yonaguniensis]